MLLGDKVVTKDTHDFKGAIYCQHLGKYKTWGIMNQVFERSGYMNKNHLQISLTQLIPMWSLIKLPPASVREATKH